MPSTFRIPKARLDGPYGRIMATVARRMWGEVPDNAYVNPSDRQTGRGSAWRLGLR